MPSPNLRHGQRGQRHEREPVERDHHSVQKVLERAGEPQEQRRAEERRRRPDGEAQHHFLQGDERVVQHEPPVRPSSPSICDGAGKRYGSLYPRAAIFQPTSATAADTLQP